MTSCSYYGLIELKLPNFLVTRDPTNFPVK